MVLPFEVDLAFKGPFRRNLIKPCVEQSEADVAEGESASDEKKALTPAKKLSNSRGGHLAFSCECHDRSPLAMLMRVRTVRSNQPWCG